MKIILNCYILEAVFFDTVCDQTMCDHCRKIIHILGNTASFTTADDSKYAFTCTYIDNPVTINGNPNFADVLEFSNKSNFNYYSFLYRLTKEVDGIKNKDLFMILEFSTKQKVIQIIERSGNRYITKFNKTIIDIKNFKKVGVMTLKDSWLDEKNCTLKRKGSLCKKEEKAVFDTIPSELAKKGCEKIYYNVYDLFYTCDYNNSISISGISEPLITSTFTITRKTIIILSIGIPVLIILGVFPLVHYYLVTKPKLKAKSNSESSGVFSDYTQSTNDTSSSEISDKYSTDSTSK
jgi:hypothetical protein